jgi:hypothetical protein
MLMNPQTQAQFQTMPGMGMNMPMNPQQAAMMNQMFMTNMAMM